MNLSDFFFFLRPRGNRLKKDVQQLQSYVLDLSEQLVRWSQEELELVSLNLTELSTKKIARTKQWKAILQSIFHESLFAIAVKRYSLKQPDYIALIRNSEVEFLFRRKPKETTVYIDGKPAAKIRNSGELISLQNKKMIGKMTPTRSGSFSVVIHGNTVAEIHERSEEAAFNQRALTLYKKMDDYYELPLLTLTLHRILHHYM